MEEELVTYEGGCHCKSVRYRVKAVKSLVCQECNCSICIMKGFVHLIVPNKNFELVEGKDAIKTYTFNTKVAQHLFCSNCGICSYYVPRSNPNGYSINVRCLDEFVSGKLIVTLEKFDGRDNWENHAKEISHLSN
eukprot:TRINITY_DN5183_c0_g1_i1.p1 TRINITY_DN5183_c0_g1~~TRINITY_DN5183_c0_g1_i1.p1  ORF type:complete len:135 (-),score=22.25 TRINITY_DN5183_c0_g1_i1:39-443(-)